MKARRLIESSNYGPETLQVIFKAFDEAWAEIAPYFEGNEQHVNDARVRLAHAVLLMAHEDSQAVELKRVALQVFQLGYGKQLGVPKL